MVAAHRCLFPDGISSTFLGCRASLRDFNGGGQQTNVLRPGLDERALLTKAGSCSCAGCGHPSHRSGWEGKKPPEKGTQCLPQQRERGAWRIPPSGGEDVGSLLGNLLQPFIIKSDFPINSSLDGAQSRRRKREQALSGEMGSSDASSWEADLERGLHPPTSAWVLSCPSSSS